MATSLVDPNMVCHELASIVTGRCPVRLESLEATSYQIGRTFVIRTFAAGSLGQLVMNTTFWRWQLQLPFDPTLSEASVLNALPWLRARPLDAD